MALGFDPIRNRLVALDGDGNTWEYLARGWLLVAGGPLTPAPGSQLVWDDARQRLQGNLGSGATLAHREWDGVSWTTRTSYSGFLACRTGARQLIHPHGGKAKHDAGCEAPDR